MRSDTILDITGRLISLYHINMMHKLYRIMTKIMDPIVTTTDIPTRFIIATFTLTCPLLSCLYNFRRNDALATSTRGCGDLPNSQEMRLCSGNQ